MSGISPLQPNQQQAYQPNISFSENQKNTLAKLIEETIFRALEKTVVPSLESIHKKLDSLLSRVEILEDKTALLEPEPNTNKSEVIEEMGPSENTEEINLAASQENISNLEETLKQLFIKAGKAYKSKEYPECIHFIDEFITKSNPQKTFHSTVLSILRLQAIAHNRLGNFIEASDVIVYALENCEDGMSKEKQDLLMEYARSLFGQKNYLGAIEILSSDQSFENLANFQYAKSVCQAMIYFKLKDVQAVSFVNAAKNLSEKGEFEFNTALEHIDKELSKSNTDQTNASSNIKIEETEDLEQKTKTQKRKSSSSTKQAKKHRV